MVPLGSWTGLRFALLGPVRAWHGETELHFDGPRQWALLAFLLLRNDEPASVWELSEAVRHDESPRMAGGMIRSSLAGLNRSFADAGVEDPIRHTAGGLILLSQNVELDVRTFTSGVGAARRARDSGDAAAAAAILRRVLARWRGTPLAGMPGPYAERERTRMVRMRTAAIEDILGRQAGTAVSAR